MLLEWAELSKQAGKEIVDFIQKREAIEAMMAEIEKDRGEHEGVWKNRIVALTSELTLIKVRLGELRQPIEAELL